MIFGRKLKEIRLEFKHHFILIIHVFCSQCKQWTARSKFVSSGQRCVGIQTDENKTNHVTTDRIKPSLSSHCFIMCTIKVDTG